MRGVTYRMAATAFVFTGLWFLIGALALLSPIPHALGIGYPMFVAWILLFFVIMAIAGASLTLAAYNGLFPSKRRSPAPRRSKAVAAAPATPIEPAEARTSDGRPLPWTESPLTQQTSRSTSSAVRPRTEPAPRRDG